MSDKPKSTSLQCPSWVKRMFSGFKSLWIIYWLCKNSRHKIICAANHRASSTSNLPCCSSSRLKSPPGQYSITKYRWFTPWKVYSPLTANFWLFSPKIIFSIWICPRQFYSTMSYFQITFSATISPLDFLLAKYTLPYPPEPNFFRTLKSLIDTFFQGEISFWKRESSAWWWSVFYLKS